MDISRPWVVFDGASHNDSQLNEGGVSLHLSSANFFNLKMGLGVGTNNLDEVMALKILLTFAGEKGVTSLHIFGDSMIVIN